MKIPYKHLSNCIASKPTIEEISEKLFQLGHEHELYNDIFNMEFTPNRGDCLSLKGLLRDLAVFFDINFKPDIYKGKINELDINFKNNIVDGCSKINFLKIEIDKTTSNYSGELKDYFNDLDIKKINFFTDISNFISYEMGQPTHCYDASKMNGSLNLDELEGENEFQTLLGDKIDLKDKNMVFTLDNQIINLAGIMGGKNTSCSDSTRTSLIECAYFKPEIITGKAIKYGIKSDAAHKFERGVDPECHEIVLRRFIEIVSKHTSIKNLELYTEDNYINHTKSLDIDNEKISNILGISISSEEYIKYLKKLGFIISKGRITVPPFRSDVITQNDLSEEIARVIGYDNIPSEEIKLKKNKTLKNNDFEKTVKSYLIDNGFYEVINFPFSTKTSKIKLDNPLDINKSFFRNDLKESLIQNLLFNERRQKDSIKLFEISDIYSNSKKINREKVIGIIASGRVGKNYNEFSQKINQKYMRNTFKSLSRIDFNFEEISRDKLDTKLKNPIFYLEIKTNNLDSHLLEYASESSKPKQFIKYNKISDYPSSSRDLSFSLGNSLKLEELQSLILSQKARLLKEVFIFDFYHDKNKEIMKIGFRFIFQSSEETIKDKQIDEIMNDIIKRALSLEGVKIPGLHK